jgi:hypothetical protein
MFTKGKPYVVPRMTVKIRCVVGPHGPDGEEARDVGQEAGPLMPERVPNRFRFGRNVDLEHEQRDSDGEDAIGKGLEASGADNLVCGRPGRRLAAVLRGVHAALERCAPVRLVIGSLA